VEWAHAIAPQANIILVEASSTTLSSLFGAVTFAAQQSGVTVVSMSWGTSEFWGESTYDSVFTTPAGHANVTFVASSGDNGAWLGPEYPSVSPNVLAVGGTTLNLNSSGAYGSETGWSGSTGGFSGFDMFWWYYETAPAAQVAAQAASGLSYGVRTTPDVSFNADPNTGVAVYDSVSYNGEKGWFDVGGTSAAAPAWAGLIAITDQGLAAAGKSSLSTTQTMTDLYSLPSSDYNSITSGFNGYSATQGYNLVTGLGTPKSAQLIAGMLTENGASQTLPTPSKAGSSKSSTTTTTTGPTQQSSGKVTKLDLLTDGLSSTSSTAGQLAASAASSTSATFMGPLNSSTGTQSINIQAQAANLPQLQPASTSSTGAVGRSNNAGQSLATPQTRLSEPSNSDEPEWTGTAKAALNAVRHAPPEEAPPADSPEASGEPPVGAPVQPPQVPAAGDASKPLDRVGEGAMGRVRDQSRGRAESEDESDEANPGTAFSALVGSGALAAFGYRFVVRSSNGEKQKNWWSARFPTC
jgi:subtilase family serine protease